MLNLFVFVCMDDILIFSRNEGTQIQHVWCVRQHCLDQQLFVTVKKGVCVGIVLYQRSKKDNKLHPFAFLCWKLSATKRNYDMCNRELLAIKMALEEWCYWLEGAKHLSVDRSQELGVSLLEAFDSLLGGWGLGLPVLLHLELGLASASQFREPSGSHLQASTTPRYIDGGPVYSVRWS